LQQSGRYPYLLWQADLIDTGGEEWEVEIQPTPLLRSLFSAMPPMEALYPVLVELVLSYRYGGVPGFVDAAAITRRLVELGITQEGLVTLRNRVRNVTCPLF
jgi:hypothetical protein